jgi:hypothetical protein
MNGESIGFLKLCEDGVETGGDSLGDLFVGLGLEGLGESLEVLLGQRSSLQVFLSL